jgi:hypothetical protein
MGPGAVLVFWPARIRPGCSSVGVTYRTGAEVGRHERTQLVTWRATVFRVAASLFGVRRLGGVGLYRVPGRKFRSHPAVLPGRLTVFFRLPFYLHI